MPTKIIKRMQRNFCLGSEWLYYKIYTGYRTADLILTEIIKPISVQLIKEEIIDKWFFIRYSDPNHHLRLRFHSPDPNNLHKVISILFKPLNEFIEQDLIWKIQTDTYMRELERYGKNTMEISESFFYHDSVSVVQFLDLIEGDEGEELRWLYGLRSIDQLLDSFKYLIEEKLFLINNLKQSFGREFGMSRPLKKQLDDKYRTKRGSIEAFMIFTKQSHPEYEPILNILYNKNKIFQPLAVQILNFRKTGKLQLEFNNLIGTYIHMIMNRLFKSKNRLNEMVCYDFLYRYYRMLLALNKQESQ